MFKLDPAFNFTKLKLIQPVGTDDTEFQVGPVDPVRPLVINDPSVVGQYNLVIWNASLYNDPTDDPDVEIVRATSAISNSFTVIRAQETTKASAKNSGTYYLQVTMTQKMINDIDNALNNVNTYTNNSYPEIQTVKDALDELLYIFPSVNLSVSPTPSGNPKEIGQTATSVSLSWTVNKNIISQSLNNNIGSLETSIRTLNSPTVFNSDLTFTITVNDGKNSASSSASVVFRNKRWWGVNSKTSLSSTDIISLANSEFATDYLQTKSFDATGGKYIYFAFPSSFTGTPVFTIGGFTAPFDELTQVSHTNQSGFTSNYRVFKSTNLQNDSNITVVVK